MRICLECASELPDQWLSVTTTNKPKEFFCSWQCMAKYLVKRMPPEEVQKVLSEFTGGEKPQ